MSRQKLFREGVTEFERKLVDEGKLIEAGWTALKLAAVPKDASPEQLDDLRSFFFAGAQHLFTTIMDILEPDAEPTAKDLERMDKIDKELRVFYHDFVARRLHKQGTA